MEDKIEHITAGHEIESDDLKKKKKKYKKEIKKLQTEIDGLVQQKQNQIKNIEKECEEKKQLLQSELENLENKVDKYRAEVKSLPNGEEQASRRLSCVKQEEDLLEREEDIINKHRDLEEYEKEIEKVEGYLDRRQQICDHKEEELKELGQELRLLNEELQKYREDLERQGVDVNSRAGKAKVNWEFLRHNVISRESQLELTVKNLRTELNGKDAFITMKDSKMMELQQKLKQQDELMRKIEADLANSKRHNLELNAELQQSKLNVTDQITLPRNSDTTTVKCETDGCKKQSKDSIQTHDTITKHSLAAEFNDIQKVQHEKLTIRKTGLTATRSNPLDYQSVRHSNRNIIFTPNDSQGNSKERKTLQRSLSSMSSSDRRLLKMDLDRHSSTTCLIM